MFVFMCDKIIHFENCSSEFVVPSCIMNLLCPFSFRFGFTNFSYLMDDSHGLRVGGISVKIGDSVRKIVVVEIYISLVIRDCCTILRPKNVG